MYVVVVHGIVSKFIVGKEFTANASDNIVVHIRQCVMILK